MRQKLIAANWKMNGNTLQVDALIEALRSKLSNARFQNSNIVICPSYIYIESVLDKLQGSGLQVGAQDVSSYANGAYTGQISAQMLADIGCKYVIIGHSERRQYCFEDSTVISKKLSASVDFGLTPIFCVGETKSEREQGVTEEVISRQIVSVVEACGIDVFAKATIAYEPIWAIGTGLTATPEQAQAVHAFIRHCLQAYDRELSSKITILYGGSVNAKNASSLFAQQDIDGGLVGGASLNAEEFVQICEAAVNR